MSKEEALAKLAAKRKADRWEGYTCIGDYHGGGEP